MTLIRAFLGRDAINGETLWLAGRPASPGCTRVPSGSSEHAPGPAGHTVTVSWIDAIGPGWLTDVLRAAGVTKAAVRHIETQPLGVASAAGELARLSLTFEPMRQPGPATIIAKAPGRGPTQRAMDAAMGLFARERFVYAELASALPVRLPRCFHVGDQGKHEPMLLEDLGAPESG